MSEEDIQRLLNKARERNKEHNITGMLLSHHLTFMQYIEGPKNNLEKIYRIIENDPDHRGIILMINTEIKNREFNDWSMAYAIASAEKIHQLKKANWLERDDQKSQGRILLSDYWKSNTL